MFRAIPIQDNSKGSQASKSPHCFEDLKPNVYDVIFKFMYLYWTRFLASINQHCSIGVKGATPTCTRSDAVSAPLFLMEIASHLTKTPAFTVC